MKRGLRLHRFRNGNQHAKLFKNLWNKSMDFQKEAKFKMDKMTESCPLAVEVYQKVKSK